MNELERATAAGGAFLAAAERERKIRQSIGEDNARLLRKARAYCEKHPVPEPVNTRYDMKADQTAALICFSRAGYEWDAVALAFEYGLAKGYRAGGGGR